MSRSSLAKARANADRLGWVVAIAPDPIDPPPAPAPGRPEPLPPAPPHPEDDESGRGVPRFGPALLVGVLFWAAVVLLLL